MTRLVALPVTLLATVMVALAADQSPGNKSEEPDAFDIEPPLLKQNLSDLPLSATPAPDGDAARLEIQLARAKRNAASAEPSDRYNYRMALYRVAAQQSQQKCVLHARRS